MGSARLWAIAIDEVRDIFGASPDLAARLRGVAAERFGTVPDVTAGRLGRLGPVFRRAPGAPVVRPEVPSGSDVDTLLAGRYVPPHRLSASWTLLEAWLDALAWGGLAREAGEAGINEFDFDLARAGVPARHGLRSLFTTDLGIPLMPCPGLAAGWTPRAHTEELADAWRAAAPQLQPPHLEAATALLDWLDAMPDWVAEAGRQGRPAPDLLAVLRG